MKARDLPSGVADVEAGRRDAFLETGRISAAAQERLADYRRQRLAEAEEALARVLTEGASEPTSQAKRNHASALRTRIATLKGQLAGDQP